jgi:glyoxylase-like metal-dependent hydrolase (beta-lactamase superfamily II)
MKKSSITRHSDSFIQVKVPLPFPLRWVNSYLIRGRDGYTLIDPGLHTEEAEQMWLEALDHLNVPFQAIEKIVLTHHHPDHYGLSGWFQEKAGVSVHISQAGHEQALRLWGGERTMTEQLCSLFLQHGMDQETANCIVPHMESFIPLVSPQPRVDYIYAGDRFNLGDRPYEVMHTPGHALGHLCFYDADARIMVCGDQVLPQISPNVSYLPDTDADPLHSFLESLRLLSRFDVTLAYPGHRDPFANFTERCAELLHHHQARLEVMLAHMSEPITAYRLCKLLFGENLSIHQLRFAMSETLAHVVYLERQGRLVRIDREGTVHFQEVSK